jgi:hypothetical protein
MTRAHAADLLKGPVTDFWVGDDAQHVILARTDGGNLKNNMAAEFCYGVAVTGDVVVTTAAELAVKEETP